MTQVEIDARRHALAAEYLALEDCRSERGLEIAHEFGVLAEQDNHLQRRRWTSGESAGREPSGGIVPTRGHGSS